MCKLTCQLCYPLLLDLQGFFEARDLDHKPQFTTSRSISTPRNVSGTSYQAPLMTPIKRMTTKELNEMRRKGLCFRYNDKFGLGHVCKRLFMIRATCNDSDDDEKMEIVSEVHQEDVKPEISLHAIAGLKAPNTMRLAGSLFFHPMEVLIDSWSTHNFISVLVVERVGLNLKQDRKMEVMVASGEKLVSPGRCSNVQLKLQKVPIAVEFFILPLESLTWCWGLNG